MGTKIRAVRGALMLGLGAVILGCNREPPLAEPPLVEVVISKPLSEKVVDWDTYTGEVVARGSVDVRARVRGEIKDVPFKDGDEVEAGKLLFLIDPDPFEADLKQAKGQLQTWEAKLKAAEEKIAIYEPLAKKGTVSRDELIQALAAKGEAVGGIGTAKGKVMEAEVNIGFCKIHAPVSGKTGLALLTKGNIANALGAENLLTTIVPVDPLYVDFNVNERALLKYLELMRKQFEREKKPGHDKIEVQMAVATDQGYPHNGKIDFIDNKVDSKTGSIKVRARFDNPKGPDGRRRLTPGLFARVRVPAADPYPAILVADRAVLADQSLHYVLVVNKEKGNLVERVDVVVSNRVQEDGLRVVEAGLKGDEWVIVEGVNRARPGATVKPVEAPMPRRPKGGK
jgi:multidrug efflux system membrane fusion protein